MKVWKAFSGDHSAKLRIIGTFKTIEDAKKAADLFNELLAVGNKDKGKNLYFSDEIMEVLDKHNFHWFNEHDPEQLDLYSELEPKENKIIVETDEEDVQALLKVLLRNGARIELYSQHDYPNK